jgi:Leucine-rich repeat (LRR) protein
MSIETNEEIKLLKKRIKELEDENKKLKKFTKYPIISNILDISDKDIKSFEDIFIDGYYTKEELNSIIYFNCSYNHIETFKGLDSWSFHNLRFLICSNNKIKSFEGLSSANLPNLIQINCSYNPLDFVYENRTIQEIYHINDLLRRCKDNTKIWIVKKFLKDKIKERLIRKD